MKNLITFDIEYFIDEYSSYVFKIVDNCVGSSLNYQDKEEIVADTFFILWKNQSSIHTNLKSYLATIARNCSYNYLRKHKSSYDMKEEILIKKYENIDQILLIKQKLEKLTEEEKNLFELYYVYGYKINEIAKTLKIKNGTVKIRLFRLRKKLKEEEYEY